MKQFLCLFFIAAVSAVSLYPPPHWTHTFITPDSLKVNSACIWFDIPSSPYGEQIAAQQGGYQFVQGCPGGQIVLGWNKNLPNFTSIISLGLIGDVYGAVVDLGSSQDIRTANNISINVPIGSEYSSIHFDDETQKIVVATTNTNGLGGFVPIVGSSEIATTNEESMFKAQPNHIYLARLSDGPSQNLADDKEIAIFKLYVLDAEHTDSFGRVTLRWDIMWYNNPPNNPPQPNAATIFYDAFGVAVAGFIIALISLIMGAVALYQLKKRHPYQHLINS
jgi:hypothetical protein